MKDEEEYGRDILGSLRLLDRPISYHRVFVKWTGSVNAALMLSQLVYWSLRTTDPRRWVYKTAAEWEGETGMTPREQKCARKNLGSSGVVEEKLAGNPATLHFRITPKFFKLLHSSLTETVKQDETKRPNKFDGNGETCLTETVKLIGQRLQTETTQKRNTVKNPAGALPAPSSNSSPCIFPPEGEVSPFIKKACDRLEDFIRISRKLNPHIKRSKWHHDMALLLQELSGDKARLKRVLQGYIETAHTEYTPQVESAGSFRKKFIKVETWLYKDGPPQSEPRMEIIEDKMKPVKAVAYMEGRDESL